VKLLDSRFQCCADLQELFQPISPDLSALQLSKGSLEGRLQIFNLGTFRLSLLETNQALFLSGTRRPEPCTIAIPLSDPQSADPIRGQGIDMPWPGLMGYNHQLRDFDLRLAANTALASLIISKENLNELHQQRNAGDLPLERWEYSNQLELCEPIRTQLRTQLRDLIDNHNDANVASPTNRIIDSLFQAFQNQNARTLPMAKRQTRHTAAIELLHWCSNNPSKNLTITELSNLLYQSRTSLFNGCQEHFGRTPIELQRSIRLDLVRQLLLNRKRSDALGLRGIGAIAAHMGFGSRSHFARRYEQQYNELPQQTLIRGSAADKETCSNKSK
jgi:AraC-like DNA-binding protein